MAICALRKRQWLLEIASGVAFAASNFQVHSEQRVFCFGMVKLHRCIYFFPAGCRVTGFASSLESAFVRVRMAIGAGVKFNPSESHCLFGPGRKMAFFTRDLGMPSCQRIFCFGMVELLRLFPVGHIMATLAVGPELAFVDVRMAC